jgi:CDP-glycerol glycerophosphotransferase (TagB/SpsB family)
MAIAIGNHLVPKKRQLLLHSFPDVEDQLVAILRWLEESDCRWVPVVLLVAGSPADARTVLRRVVGEVGDRIRILPKDSLHAVWAYWRSKVVIFTHGLYNGYFPTPRGQRLINVWHGMPVKSIWSANRNKRATAKTHCSELLSTSAQFTRVLSEISGVDSARIREIGIPRNDLLLQQTPAGRSFRQRAIQGADRLMIYLPTYRKSRLSDVVNDGVEMGNVLMMDEKAVVRLKKFLRSTRTRWIVKAHPMSVHFGHVDVTDEFLWIVSDSWLHDLGVTLYDVLGQVDALVTDVSSVYIDYLIVGRPIFFFFPDLPEYR